uniref:Uncharacterized protein n=1 Tax=Anguilla anguilla TaxID=7936 RepID=A0A0E9UJ74_ANGAN
MNLFEFLDILFLLKTMAVIFWNCKHRTYLLCVTLFLLNLNYNWC